MNVYKNTVFGAKIQTFGISFKTWLRCKNLSFLINRFEHGEIFGIFERKWLDGDKVKLFWTFRIFSDISIQKSTLLRTVTSQQSTLVFNIEKITVFSAKIQREEFCHFFPPHYCHFMQKIVTWPFFDCFIGKLNWENSQIFWLFPGNHCLFCLLSHCFKMMVEKVFNRSIG